MIHQKLLPTFIIILLFASCKYSEKEVITTMNSKENFENMLKDYYEEGLKLNPVNATISGDNRYNDKFINPLSSGYIALSKS
jgi:hypothetical protein